MRTRSVGCAVAAAAAMVALLHQPLHADVVWPALELESRLFTAWIIGLSLVIEAAFLVWMIRVKPVRALAASAGMNAVSAALGLVLVPLAGVVWEVVVGLPLFYWLGIGTFNPFTWAGTAVLAVVVNVALERLVLSRGFKHALGRREVGLLACANAITVAIAMVSLYVAPVQYSLHASGSAAMAS